MYIAYKLKPPSNFDMGVLTVLIKGHSLTCICTLIMHTVIAM